LTLNARQEELTARYLLTHQEQIPVSMKQQRWGELVALVEYVRPDVPPALTRTDPALYRLLREQVTEFHLRGWVRASPTSSAVSRRSATSATPVGIRGKTNPRTATRSPPPCAIAGGLRANCWPNSCRGRLS